jgi:hypothetical protein
MPNVGPMEIIIVRVRQLRRTPLSRPGQSNLDPPLVPKARRPGLRAAR